jgi:hypothetical protein
MLASLIVFSTCTQVEVINPENPGDENLLLGKWEISDQNATYGSFEFTSDKKYIVTQRVTELPGTKSSNVLSTRADNNQNNNVYIIIIFGDYTSLQQDGNSYTLDLKEFGTIIITIKDGDATITVNGEIYIGNKTEPVDISERTELLCHTWSVKQYKHIYEDGSFKYKDNDDIESVTFTKDGTVFTDELSKKDINEYEPDSDEHFIISISDNFGTWEWAKNGKIKLTTMAYWKEWDNKQLIDSGSYLDSIDYDIINLTESELIFSQDNVDADIIKSELILYR